MKRNKSLETPDGERNKRYSSSNDFINTRQAKDRKLAMLVGTKGPRQKWQSILDDLSSSARRNEKLDSDENSGKRADSLMAREVERLQKLKLEVMRMNDERRKSYAGFEYKKRLSQRLLVPLDEPVHSETKASYETKEPKPRSATINLPIEKRDTLQLPRIEPLNFKTLQKSRRVEPKQDCRSYEKAAENRKDFKKTRHKHEKLSIRYGSPLPCQLKDPLGQEEKARKPSKGPQITISGFADLNLKVKDFVQKSQPGPSETSLRVARRTKLPSINSEIKQNRNTKLSEDAKHLIVNMETCPPISFYEDRSWYYQDKRGKCRYLRIPESPVPPISSVFEKD